jgi:adenosylhomocysteinase
MGESRDRQPDLETRLRWARKNMPHTEEEIRLLPPLREVRLACSIHLEPKVAPSLDGLLERGERSPMRGEECNPPT